MKKLFLGIVLGLMVIAVKVPTTTAADITIGISLPPPIVFAAPPDMVVIPSTDDVYVVPAISADIFFWNGWWWRLWDGNWYYARVYNQGWVYYNNVPRFYFDVDPNWRDYYRRRIWYGHRWDYERIPFERFERHWRNWHENHYWERQKRWGIPNYRPLPERQIQELRRQRQEQYERNLGTRHQDQPHPPQHVQQPQGHIQQQFPQQPQRPVPQVPQQHVQQPQGAIQQQFPQQPQRPVPQVPQQHVQQPQGAMQQQFPQQQPQKPVPQVPQQHAQQPPADQHMGMGNPQHP